MLPGPRKVSAIAASGFALALLAAAAAVLSAVGYRLEFLALIEAFTLLRWAAYLAVAAALVCLVGLVAARPGGIRRGFTLAVIGVAAATATFWVPFSMQRTANRVPPIHDITTDFHSPPAFVALVEARSAAPNGHAYGGSAVADQQRSAYPDIRTFVSDAAPKRVFDAAVASAGAMGWEIIAVSADDGRIEATDTTLWFAFKDDVVIRVQAQGPGSVVDVRSASRIGRSDLGKNAQRVRAFLSELKSELDASS